MLRSSEKIAEHKRGLLECSLKPIWETIWWQPCYLSPFGIKGKHYALRMPHWGTLVGSTYQETIPGLFLTVTYFLDLSFLGLTS